MQKAIAIVLLIVTLLGSMVDLNDFIKLPRLLEHYQEHKKKSSNGSFFTFLNLHYGSEAERHDREEHQKHANLPFKSVDCTFAHTVVVVPQFKSLEITSLNPEVTFSNFYYSAFSLAFIHSIWQPPRLLIQNAIRFL